MRWFRKIKTNPDVRYVKRFAFFPIKVTETNEVRWLEIVYLKQKRWYDWDEKDWENQCFLTKEEFINAIVRQEQEEFAKRLEVCYHCFDEKCRYNKDHWCSLGHEAKVDNNGVCYSREGF